MNYCIRIFTIAAVVCVVAGVKRRQQAYGISNVDIKDLKGSTSYCSGGICRVKAGTTVKITFTIVIDKPISSRQWTAKISAGKVVFDGWYACLTPNSEVVIQNGKCSGKVDIPPGKYSGYVIVVLSDKPTKGHLIFGNSAPYISDFRSVEIY